MNKVTITRKELEAIGNELVNMGVCLQYHKNKLALIPKVKEECDEYSNTAIKSSVGAIKRINLILDNK